ncbi:hypothetical protein STANM309S_00677 [Streptomyces tanashiensis]
MIVRILRLSPSAVHIDVDEGRVTLSGTLERPGLGPIAVGVVVAATAVGVAGGVEESGGLPVPQHVGGQAEPFRGVRPMLIGRGRAA